MAAKVVEQLRSEKVERAAVVLAVEVIIMVLIGSVLVAAEALAELVQLDILLLGALLDMEVTEVLVSAHP
jgi:hypothetical protein